MDGVFHHFDAVSVGIVGFPTLAMPANAAWMQVQIQAGSVSVSTPVTVTATLNSANASGQTNTTLTITNLSLGNMGDYIVVVTNNFGTVTSTVADTESSAQAQTVALTPW